MVMGPGVSAALTDKRFLTVERPWAPSKRIHWFQYSNLEYDIKWSSINELNLSFLAKVYHLKKKVPFLCFVNWYLQIIICENSKQDPRYNNC